MRGAAVDPTEWANRKKAAVERAKKLREERQSGQLTENDTFQPQVNPRRPSSNHNSKPAESLTSNYANPNDPMEQPLAANRSNNSNNTNNSNYNNYGSNSHSGKPPAREMAPPSPGSDALGREVKRQGGSGAVPASRYESVNKKKADEEHKNKFLRQYEDTHSDRFAPPPQANNNGANNNGSRAPAYNAFDEQPVGRAANNASKAANPDDEFMNYLRSDDNNSTNGVNRASSGSSRRSAGPGWNNDTSTDNIPAPRVKTRPSRPAVQQAMQSRRQEQEQEESSGYYKQQDSAFAEPVRPPRASPRASSGGDMMSQYQNSSSSASAMDSIVAAKPKLSLLKSKIRLSQGAAAASTANASYAAQAMPLPEPVASNSYSNHSSARMAGRAPRNMAYQEDEQELQSHSSMQPVAQAQPRRARLQAQQQQPPWQTQVQQEEEALDNDIVVAVPKNRRVAPAQPSTQQPPQYQQQQQQQQSYYDAPTRAPPVQNQKMRSSTSAPSRHYNEEQEEDDNNGYGGGNKAPQQRNNGGFNNNSNSNYSAANMREEEDEQDYYGGEMDDDAGGANNGVQHECPDCGRKFNETAYPKHVKICAKVFMKKRKAFDSRKMRLGDDPELVKMFTKAQKEEKKQQMLAAKKSAAPAAKAEEQPVGGSEKAAKWKLQSEAFREALKAAREYKKAVESGAPLPPPPVSSVPDPTLTPCPHCGRRFNDKAAERHIPLCQNIKAKPNSLKRGTGINSANGTALATQKNMKKKF